MLRAILIRAALVGAGLLIAAPVWAQSGAPTPCGPTSIGTSAAAIAYPASGSTGPPSPSQFVTITNPNASGYLCVNPTGTAATSGSGCAAGSDYLGPLGAATTYARPAYPPPATISVIGSVVSMALTCRYQ